MNARERADLARDLPDFVDLMLAGVEAGWSLDQTVLFLVGQHPSATSRQLQRAGVGMEDNVSTLTALQTLSTTSALPDVSRLVNAIDVSRQAGASLAPVLRIQVSEIRRELRQRTERKIKQTAPKMSLVTILFLFPALICALGAPAAATVLHNLFHAG